MPEIRRLIGPALAASLALGSHSSAAEEPVGPIVGLVEDTANSTVPGCDAISFYRAKKADKADKTVKTVKMDLLKRGEYSVSHGHPASKEANSSTPDRRVYNVIMGRMNSKNNLLTGEVVIDDRNMGVTTEEHFMQIEDRVPFAGAVAVLKANGESGATYAAATINFGAYEKHLPARPIVENPRMDTGYQISIYSELVDDVTGEHSLGVAGPDAVFQTGSLLVSRMIFDEESSELTGLAYDKSCQDIDNCHDRAYFVRYRVIVDNDQYSLVEILREEIVAKEDPYDKVEAERVGAFVQIGYNSYAYTNGLSEIIIVDVTDTIVSQKSTSVNLGREIRSLTVDPQTGLLLIVCDAVVYTARFESGKVEIIDSNVNPASPPSEETGGTADAIFSDGIAMMPTSNGENDVKILNVGPDGKIESSTEIAVCADNAPDDDANIMAGLFPLNEPEFIKATSTATPTKESSATPSETSTSTATSSPIRYPTVTQRSNEPTPTLGKPTAVAPSTPTRENPTAVAPSTATNPPKPYSKSVYIPLSIQHRRQGNR